MKMTEREERFLVAFRRLENERSRDDVIFRTEMMLRVQDALKADYGLYTKEPPKRTA
jgi:hypothetical protein